MAATEVGRLVGLEVGAGDARIVGKKVFVGREVGILGWRVGWEDGTLGMAVREDFLRVGLEVGFAVDFAEGLLVG